MTHLLRAAMFFMLSLFFIACGGDDDGSTGTGIGTGGGSGEPCELRDGADCRCGPTADGTLSECSEASIGEPALCCESGDSCACTEMGCADNGIICTCSLLAILDEPDDIPVASCEPAADEFCCIGDGTSIGSLCICGILECLPGEIQVPSCTTTNVQDCGLNDEVSSCS